MVGSFLENLRFGQQSCSSSEGTGFTPTPMNDFLASLHDPEAFGHIDTDGTPLQIQQTTWQQFVTDVALHPDLGLNLQPFESTFSIHPGDMDMTEYRQKYFLGFVAALGTNYHLDDASLVVALDLKPVGYDLPERHLGESGKVRPMHLYICGLATSIGEIPIQRILMVTYELAGLRPKTLPHQIGAYCEAIEFAISTQHPSTLTLDELGLHKGMETVHRKKRTTLPYSTTMPIDGFPMITECMKSSVPGQTHMAHGAIIRQNNKYIPQFQGPRNIQVFPGDQENNNQVHICTEYQSHFFFPAFLGKSLS